MDPEAMDIEAKYAAALDECRGYNEVGGLDGGVLADIAHDRGVDAAELRRRWDED